MSPVQKIVSLPVCENYMRESAKAEIKDAMLTSKLQTNCERCTTIIS